MCMCKILASSHWDSAVDERGHLQNVTELKQEGSESSQKTEGLCLFCYHNNWWYESMFGNCYVLVSLLALLVGHTLQWKVPSNLTCMYT